MTGPKDLELLRLLRGELPPEEARRLRARLLREPELAEAYHRLERSWRSLELPPPSPVPHGFSTRVMARVRQTAQTAQTAAGRDSWASAPGWVRATAAAALVTGVAAGWAGAGLGRLGPAAVSTREPAPAVIETPAPPVNLPAGAAVEATAPPGATPEAAPERALETAPAGPAIAGLAEEETAGSEEELFAWDGDLADSYWEAVESLSTPEAEETGETGGAVP